MRRLSLSDELTGLANRRGLNQRLDELVRQLDAQTPVGLLLIDVDDFKQINDRHGHLAGDRILQTVASELFALTGACDLPCRLGGDEFALLVVNTEAAALADRAQQLVSSMRRRKTEVGGGDIHARVSIGASLGPLQQAWVERYSNAETALYCVKAKGGDGWSLHPGSS